MFRGYAAARAYPATVPQKLATIRAQTVLLGVSRQLQGYRDSSLSLPRLGYAKELLGQQKTLLLPDLILQEEGLSEIVFKPGIYDFKKVLPELKFDTFQPDALASTGASNSV